MDSLAVHSGERRDPARLADFDQNDPATAAVAFAAAGFPVFPLHTPDAEGRCSCRRDCGRDNGKHPRTANGLTGATAQANQVAKWWATWPEANVAVVTGDASGAWVLDIDPHNGGEAAIAALEAAHGALPPTWAVETGGGGLHLWWRRPGYPVPTSVGRVGPGLDVRGEGGYVVAPPSLHRSMVRYRWGASWSPALAPLAPPPDWLRARVATPPRPAADPADATASIVEGQRNATLASLAGTMRRRGCTEGAILAALLVENAERCAPPLDPASVRKVARSVARYVPQPDSPRAPRRRPAFVQFVGGKAVAR